MPLPTTLANAIAGLGANQVFSRAITNSPTGRPVSYWAATSTGAVYDTTLNGVTLTAPLLGALPRSNAPSGLNSYLARLEVMSVGNGTFYLMDRLWHNGNIDVTSTSAQTITSPTFPARDNNGSSNGEGVFLALEVSTTIGAGTGTVTIGYTNSGNTSGRSATGQQAIAASSAASSMYFIGLQAGDLGVRSVQSITLSASLLSGVINLVAYRPIAIIPYFTTIDPSYVQDLLTSQLSRIFDDSVLFFGAQATGANNTVIYGNFVETRV